MKSVCQTSRLHASATAHCCTHVYSNQSNYFLIASAGNHSTDNCVFSNRASRPERCANFTQNQLSRSAHRRFCLLTLLLYWPLMKSSLSAADNMFVSETESSLRWEGGTFLLSHKRQERSFLKCVSVSVNLIFNVNSSKKTDWRHVLTDWRRCKIKKLPMTEVKSKRETCGCSALFESQ